MANNADPDQLASSEANWSGSTFFAKQGIFGFSRTRVKKPRYEKKALGTDASAKDPQIIH